MTDLNTVLLFFSYSMRPFLLLLMFNLFYFLVVIAATIVVFFVTYTSNNHRLFVVYLAVIIPLVYFIRSAIFLKWHLRLNIHFIHFLASLKRNDADIKAFGSKKVNLPQNLGKTLKKIKKNLKKSGINYISIDLLTTFTALNIAGKKPFATESSLQESIHPLKRCTFRFIFIKGFVFLVLFIPFCLISFFFTMGMGPAIKELIYILGFFFAWFLHSAIVLPISGLILQKRVLFFSI